MYYINHKYSIKLTDALCSNFTANARKNYGIIADKIYECLMNWTHGIERNLKLAYVECDKYDIDYGCDGCDDYNDCDLKESLFDTQMSLEELFVGIIDLEPIYEELQRLHDEIYIAQSNYNQFFWVLNDWLRDVISKWEEIMGIEYILRKFIGFVRGSIKIES